MPVDPLALEKTPDCTEVQRNVRRALGEIVWFSPRRDILPAVIVALAGAATAAWLDRNSSGIDWPSAAARSVTAAASALAVYWVVASVARFQWHFAQAGLKDQLDELTSKLVETRSGWVASRALVGQLRRKNQDLVRGAGRRALSDRVRGPLKRLLTEGEELLRVGAQGNGLCYAWIARDWADRCTEFLNAHLSSAAAALFLSDAGLRPRLSGTIPYRGGPIDQGINECLDLRIQRLRELIGRLPVR